MSEDIPSPSRAPRPLDVALAAALLAVVMLGTANMPVEVGDRPKDALAYACGVAGVGALVFWRHWAIAVVGVVAVTSVVYAAREYPGGPALLPGPLALLALGYTVPRRTAWIGAAGYVAVTVVARLAVGDTGYLELLVIVGWASAAVLAGQAVASRGERVAAARERAEHAQHQAVASERLRIARDLHDSVAHAMATINVQSGVAAHLLDRDAGQAKQALEAIRAASSDVLDEMTAILSVLRASNTGDQADDAPRTPLGTLGELGELVARAQADGMAVEVGVHGDIGTLGPAVSSAAYRVVQEALTNTRRHAGAEAHAVVAVDIGDRGALSVRVSDDAGQPRHDQPSTECPSMGFGLLGMRERVESTGGTLAAGPRPHGGFEVVATWSHR